MHIWKNFIKYVSFPVFIRRDGKAYFKQNLEYLMKSQFCSGDEMREMQRGKMKNILIHAYKNTDYYKSLFDRVGFDPFRFKDFSDIEIIPFLDKKKIRDNFDQLIAKNYSSKMIHYSETGGTSGVKMRFVRDNNCLAMKEAALYRFESWAGWDVGERIGIIWPAQQDYVGHWTMRRKIRNSLYFRQIVFPAAIINSQSVEKYIGEIVKLRPATIRAFPSPIFETAKYILLNGIEIDSIKGIITTGEPLYPHQRRVIESAFKAKIFNAYRCREVGPIAQECGSSPGMHINADGLHVEVHKNGNSKEWGNIIVTDFWNYGMPFIRYDMGDMGDLLDKKCSCGRGLPLIGDVLGRTADNLYTTNGKIVPGSALALYVADEVPGEIGQIQIIQDALDHLTIKATDDPPLSDDVKRCQIKNLKCIFGESIKIEYEVVESIPREKSGKYRFAICNISNKGDINN